MKKLIAVCLFSAFCIFIMSSCNEEVATTDELQAMVADAEPALPDLKITSITSSLNVTNGPCPGIPKADATCNGGQGANFNFTIRLANRTAIPIPPGTQMVIGWYQFGGPAVPQTITVGIPGNSSILVTSPNFNLPCPGGPPPFQLVTKQYYAEADITNVVNEFRENNNRSGRYQICDDL